MAIFEYNGIRVTGFSAAVPQKVFNNYTDNAFFSQEDALAIIGKTGIKERRVATSDICASDLCFVAAEQLLNEMGTNRDEIDVVIFVSQTPDYRMPATSLLLQDRLQLSKSCAAFDLNLGCSGFVYGLNIAYGFGQQQHIRKVLLLNGETRTRAYSFKDRQTGFIFGDAGTACLIEKDTLAPTSYFLLHSDGAKSDAIMIKAGGYRYPSSEDTLKEKVREGGSIRSDEHGVMDGAAVFEFVITAVPRQIRQLFNLSNMSMEQIDFFVHHQANIFMNGHLSRKLKLPDHKVPYSLHRYGNTSSVSIPLTIVSELYDKLDGCKKMQLSGFGVGLSWGSAIIEVASPYIGKIVEI